ncbi:hypothetical protein BpV2_021c [Bathycoccus sp. RCC1105 virus BpV2]|jgi:hypothetical protein|nr:hypothetical protein BpV2_021c [Bathycoccus sp. RCC1105 virus BpV2]
MNKVVISFIALVIVFFILRESELYTNLVLDTEWKETRNRPLTTSDPFNTCSPESFGDCKKVKMPHLSRA